MEENTLSLDVLNTEAQTFFKIALYAQTIVKLAKENAELKEACVNHETTIEQLRKEPIRKREEEQGIKERG